MTIFTQLETRVFDWLQDNPGKYNPYYPILKHNIIINRDVCLGNVCVYAKLHQRIQHLYIECAIHIMIDMIKGTGRSSS